MSFDDNNCIELVIAALDKSIAQVPNELDARLDLNPYIREQIHEMEYGEEKPLGDHLGVSRALFPPVDQLEEDEIKIIVLKILETWEVYHFRILLPEGVPVRIAYQVILSVWEYKTRCVPIGYMNLDLSNLNLDNYVNRDCKKILE